MEIFSADEKCKSNLFDIISQQITDRDRFFKDISKYLLLSFNVNQIGISSNVKTSDGKVFFGIRNRGNIDDGSLYPSVNGNAEVYDSKVSFYNQSVYEDLPSISIQDIRLYLWGEIYREAYG